jgi:hypothetical protein
MIYLPEHQTVFIHNPKTGGTSITAWLQENFQTVRGRKHGNYQNAIGFFPEAKHSFAVVRDPWARLVSWFCYANNPKRTDFKQWVLNNTVRNQPGLSFSSNLMWARNWYDLKTTQTQWIDSSTRVLKFENLSSDFQCIQQLLDCNASLPVLNCGVTTDHRSFYDDELAEFVRDIYLEDVIRFGYEY